MTIDLPSTIPTVKPKVSSLAAVRLSMGCCSALATVDQAVSI